MTTKVITFRGTCEEIGFQHGTHFKSQIAGCIEFYKRIFCLPQDEIFDWAVKYKVKVQETFPDYVIEMDAIAKGASVDARWIYALNARSEIMDIGVLHKTHEKMNTISALESQPLPQPSISTSESPNNECSSLFSSRTSVLAQNWDYWQEFDTLGILFKVERTEKRGTEIPSFVTFTEPGILGKCGLNSQGVGVLINKLQLKHDPKIIDVPVQIMLRAILECRNIEEVYDIIKKHPYGKASSFIIGDSEGHYVHVEFAGEKYFLQHNLSTREASQPSANYIYRTNHFLLNHNKEDETLPIPQGSSLFRFNQLQEFLDKSAENPKDEIEFAKSILFDDKHNQFPICRKWVPIQPPWEGTIGTVRSVIMDLIHRKFFITKSPPFVCHDLMEVQV